MAREQHILTEPRTGRAVVVVALALTGFSMRTAVTSVGAVLDDVEHGLHTTSGMSGVITTLPVVCFAGMGAVAPRLAARHGPHRLLVAALVMMSVGLVTRALAGSIWPFLLLSVLALTGGAIANVLLPIVVKRDFPDRIGQLTAVYTTALAVGTTSGSGLTVPVGSLGDGWRLGLGWWAVFSIVAALPWLTMLRNDDPNAAVAQRLPLGALVRSRIAWALTLFFAFQSLQAYIAFGWFARFLHAHGIAQSTSGWMVAALAGMGIPVSMIAPTIAPRHHRAVLGVLTGCYVVSYAGLGLAPVGGAWVWMVLAGIGSGMFPLALTMIGLRSRTAAATATLSAFVQSIGYLVAGSGPLLVGVLYGATGSWVLPLTLLWVALAVAFVTGWWACAPRQVDDELAASPA